jgi:UPF0716 protein FxsA
MRLFLILLIVPIIEIALFIEVGGMIGTWPTIAIVVLTAIIGTVMLRQQGLAALRGVQSRLAAGENPGRLLADGAMILVAGALLVTPGFFTDAVGFVLLVPAVRGWLWTWLAPRLTVVHVAGARARHAPGGPEGRRHPARGQTVEGEYEEIEPSSHPDDPEARRR